MGAWPHHPNPSGREAVSYAQKILHFYCYACKAYELKTSPHYRNQKQRLARRRRKEKKAAQTEQQGQQQT